MTSPAETQPAATGPRTTDLVLEGGGVKGLALAGAVQAFGRAGYTPARVGGTSAGALVGAVAAALTAHGEPLSRIEDVAATLDPSRFADRGFPWRYLGPVGALGDALGVLFHDGAHEGRYLHRWLTGVLGDLGVHTFGDLRTADPGDDQTMHHRYRLVVTASDLSRQRLRFLPWDYAHFGLDPDEQPVADAVRASGSIPFFYRPVTLAGPTATSTLVDGGLVSNYPVSMFDRVDGRAARWPTIGVRLDAGDAAGADGRVGGGVVGLGVAVVQTAIEAGQAARAMTPCNLARSVLVDTSGVDALDFDLDAAQRAALNAAGRRATTTFLSSWDYAQWTRTCRPAPAPSSTVG